MALSSRREFLERSMLASAGAYAALQLSNQAAQATEAPDNTSPNSKLSVAVIGVNGRGTDHLRGWAGVKGVEITHICDCDEGVGQRRCEETATQQKGRKPEFVQDIRKLLENKSIDAISIATPNHWHALGAIWGVQAGKHVYVEKPVSHNVTEGRRIVEAARKHNRIVQTGTQSRSNPGMRAAMEYLHAGKLGTVKLARGLCYKRRDSIGERGTYNVPTGVDYNLWQGPAQEAAITRPRFHYDWHWQWAYGNGDLGNQGIHQMDLCRWALGQNKLAQRVVSYGGRFGYVDAGETANTQVVILDYGPQQLVFEVRGLPTENYRGANVGIIVEAEKGYVVMGSYSAGQAFDLDGKLIEEFNGGGDNNHYQNFVDAVRAGDHKLLNADIEEGHLSSALCHLGNISLRMGEMVPANQLGERLARHVKSEEVQDTLSRTLTHLRDNKVSTDTLSIQLGPVLDIDQEKETFVKNSQADAMLTRDYRKGFEIPAAGQV